MKIVHRCLLSSVLLLIFAVVGIGSHKTSAQTMISGSPWTPIMGPWGAECNGTFGAIAIAPNNPNVIYLGSSDVSNGCGIYKSIDGGQTWAQANTGIGQVGLFSKHYPPITTIVTTKDPSILYVGTYTPLGSPVYRTSDAGTHWSAASGTVNFWGTAEISNALSLAADPTDPNTVYAGLAANGVYKSSNGGQHWQNIKSAGSSEPFHIVTFVDSSHLLIAGASSYNDTPCIPIPTRNMDSLGCSGVLPLGPFTSVDGGKNWNALTSVSGLSVTSVFLSDVESVQTGGTWRAMASTTGAGILIGPFPRIISPKGVFTIEANGVIWDQLPSLNGLNGNPPIIGAAIDQQASTQFFCFASNSIYSSQDGGSHWTTVPVPPGVASLNKIQAANNNLIAATNRGLFAYNYAPAFSASVDGGTHTIEQGQTLTMTLTIGSVHGFSGTVTPAAIGLPPGSTGQWSSQALKPGPNGQTSATLRISTTANTTLGMFPTIIRASSPGQATQTIPINVTIQAAPPNISAINPSTPARKAGNQAVVVYGSGFKPGLSVTVTFPNGSHGVLSGSGQIQRVTDSSFTMIIDFNNVGGQYSLTVNNANGASSHAFTFRSQ